MKKIFKYAFILLAVPVVLASCKKVLDTGVLNTGNFGDRGTGLKDAFNIPVGAAVSYAAFTGNTAYTNVVRSDFDMVTFEWEMKHRAIVKDDGSFDFSKADELVALAGTAGLDVFGHTLVWHQNQNGGYMNTLAGGGGGNAIVNLLSNPGFESDFTGWTQVNTGNPAGSSTFEVTSVPVEIRSGTSALKVVVDQSYGTSQWRVQLHSPGFAIQSGKTYNVSFWIKAASPGGSIRLSAAPTGTVTNAYQGDQDGIGTDWQEVTWSITATSDEAAQKISFDIGKAANTYFIDDVKVWDPEAPPPPPLLTNGGFEDGLTGYSPDNTGNPGGSSTFSITSTPSDVRSGTSALKVFVDQSYGTSQWRVQMRSPAFAVEDGKTYNISFWIKAANPGGSIRLSTSPDQNPPIQNAYQGDQDGIGTDWQQVTWSITATGDHPGVKLSFDIGKAANTYFIDDIIVEDAANAGSGGGGGDATELVDDAMKSFITQSVTRYAGKVKAWDVVNEPLVESGALRGSSNTTVPSTADPNDYFFWSDYLGRDYLLKAFNYAAAADPAALLFINEYNLETNATKLDSLIALVNELKGKGAKIDGIGTQMHVSWNTSVAGIDAMFQKLAATGLLIRISELDVKVNPLSKQGFTLTPQFEGYQASMYEYIIRSYLKHIPPAQQHGITIWGVSDNLSWLYNNGREFPLLYNEDFSKKAAYGGVLGALK